MELRGRASPGKTAKGIIPEAPLCGKVNRLDKWSSSTACRAPIKLAELAWNSGRLLLRGEQVYQDSGQSSIVWTDKVYVKITNGFPYWLFVDAGVATT
jgi:hypothetical protein